MENVFRQALDLLEQEQNFVYVSIISQDGSTPRGSGSKMLVLPDEIRATIGGGLMEAQVMERARNLLAQADGVELMNFDLSGAEAAETDFICGGNCEILLFHIDAQDKFYSQLFAAADQSFRQGSKAWLLTAYNQEQNDVVLGLTIEDGQSLGDFSKTGIGERALRNPAGIALHDLGENGYTFIVESIQGGGVVYLFGAGHVSSEVARLTNMLEFETVIIDDRADYLTPARFPGCELVLVSSMDNLPELPIDQNSYILIITRGHLHDETVLRWAIQQDAGYLGMIGSPHKRDTIYRHLEAEGVSSAKLQAVHSPIGLNIGGQTPAEIGISIAAELVQVRSKREKR